LDLTHTPQRQPPSVRVFGTTAPLGQESFNPPKRILHLVPHLVGFGLNRRQDIQDLPDVPDLALDLRQVVQAVPETPQLCGDGARVYFMVLLSGSPQPCFYEREPERCPQMLGSAGNDGTILAAELRPFSNPLR